MKEVISVHVGQAGVQSGNANWELLTAEHNIGTDGRSKGDAVDNCGVNSFFKRTDKGQYVPRSVFVDLEPSVVDEVRIGKYRHVFNPCNLITGYDDASNNFARGYFIGNGTIMKQVEDMVRREFENADCPIGFMVYRSLGGGTGSGFTSALIDHLEDYNKTTKVDISIHPSPTFSSGIVEPYNCILTEHFSMDSIDIGLLLDNEALYNITSSKLMIANPTFTNVNRIIAQLCSNITLNAADSVLQCDISIMQTNLIPYPRIHFPLISMAPILGKRTAEHEDFSVFELITHCFHRSTQMISLDPKTGFYMSCALFFRGCVNPSKIYEGLAKVKSTTQSSFVDWCPTGFKVGMTNVPQVSVAGSSIAPASQIVTMLANNTSVGQVWQRMARKCDLLYSKRSFVHWYVGEGLEESELHESLQNIQSLVQDYIEAGGMSSDNVSKVEEETLLAEAEEEDKVEEDEDVQEDGAVQEDGEAQEGEKVQEDVDAAAEENEAAEAEQEAEE